VSGQKVSESLSFDVYSNIQRNQVTLACVDRDGQGRRHGFAASEEGNEQYQDHPFHGISPRKSVKNGTAHP